MLQRSRKLAKVRGRNRITGNRSVRSRPLAPSQPPPRIAIAGDVPRGAAKGRLSKLPLKKVRLILIVEADLKPNTPSGVRNWFDRDWLDVAVIQPNTDDIHSSAEGIAGLFLDTYDECRIGRHIALLP